jgi:tetratricopeptide (TPR) repeat protein
MARRTEFHRSSAHQFVLGTTLLMSSMALTSTSGCRAIKERRAQRAVEREQARANEQQPREIAPENTDRGQSESQSQWLERQPIAKTTETESTHPNQGGADGQMADGQMKVVDDRPSAQGVANPQSSDEPSIDIIDPNKGRVFNRRPKDEVSFTKAIEFHASGELDQALRELERAIAFNPKFTLAYIESGDIYLEMAEYDLAERQFSLAVRSEPRNFMAQYRHGQVLHQLGRLEESNRAYLRALSIRPGNFDANLGISIVLLEMGRAEQALPYGQRAVKSEPPSGRARMNLGTVYAALDRHEEAIIEYQQAGELMDAPTPGLLLNMAESLNQLQRYAEMVGALEQLVRIAPDAIAYERLGSGLFRLRRYDESLAAFRKSADYDPNHFPAYNGIAVCELNQYLWSTKTDAGARERAVEAMRKSLRLDRKQPRIVELLRRYTKASSTEK